VIELTAAKIDRPLADTWAVPDRLADAVLIALALAATTDWPAMVDVAVKTLEPTPETVALPCTFALAAIMR